MDESDEKEKNNEHIEEFLSIRNTLLLLWMMTMTSIDPQVVVVVVEEDDDDEKKEEDNDASETLNLSLVNEAEREHDDDGEAGKSDVRRIPSSLASDRRTTVVWQRHLSLVGEPVATNDPNREDSLWWPMRRTMDSDCDR